MDLKLGKINKMKICDIDDRGAILRTYENGARTIRLPKAELTEEMTIGDAIDVFIYKDSRERWVATAKKAYGEVGELAYLRVINITNIGAFLDLGVEKDILLPFSEQVGSLEDGKHYLVKIYIDKSERICATMKIDDDLESNPDYKEGQMVEGTVYSFNPRLGAFVAVENKYYGFAHLSQIYKTLSIGDKASFRVVNIREDGRVDLSTRQLAHIQMGEDSQIIIKALTVRNGYLPINDKSDPEEIRNYLSMSKAAFKRALGRLLKAKKVEQTDTGIKLLGKIKDIEERD